MGHGSGEQGIDAVFCVGELIARDAELALQGDEEVAEECFLLVGILGVKGEVAFVFKSATGDDGWEVVVGMTTGVAHPGAPHDDGFVE